MRGSPGDISKAPHLIKCLCDSNKTAMESNTKTGGDVHAICATRVWAPVKAQFLWLHQMIWDTRHIVHVGHLGGKGLSTVGARPGPGPHRLTLTFALTTTREGCFELLAKFPWRKTQIQAMASDSYSIWKIWRVKKPLSSWLAFIGNFSLEMSFSISNSDSKLAYFHITLSTWGQQRTQITGDSKLTTEEIVDDGISSTVGVYEPMGESEPRIHGLSVISILETPENPADLKKGVN